MGWRRDKLRPAQKLLAGVRGVCFVRKFSTTTPFDCLRIYRGRLVPPADAGVAFVRGSIPLPSIGGSV